MGLSQVTTVTAMQHDGSFIATAPPEQDHPEPVVDAEVVEDDAPDETASATVVLPPDPATQRQKRRRRLWRR